jgi:drug/metabolite transporter (DMT)-like permease
MSTNKEEEGQIKPYLFIMCAAVLWASGGTASKYLFNSGMSPYVLVQYRVSFSVPVIFGYLLFFERHLLKINKKDLLNLAILGAFGMGGVQVTYLFAISKIKVAMAILLQYLAPFFVAIYSCLFLNERMDRWKALSIFLAFIGCFFVVEAYSVSFFSLDKWGVIAGLLSAGFFSFYSLLGEGMMRKYNPWTTLLYAFVFAAILFNCILPPKNLLIWKTEFRTFVTVTYIISFGTAIPFGFYFMGIEHLRATRATIVATLEPISAGIISFIMLGEVLTSWQIFGGFLVITAIIIIQSRREIDPEAPVFMKKNRSFES